MGVTIDDGGTAPPPAPVKPPNPAKTNPPTTPGTSSKSSTNKNQAYIQMYRLLFGANVKPNMNLINQAVKNRWSSSYFKMQVRLKDPRYFKSVEAKQKTAEFQQYWKSVFPDAPMNKKILKDYLRQGWSSQQLFDQVRQTQRFQREYKHFGAFERAQRQAGQAKVVNPLAYKQYQDTFRDAFSQAGVQAPTGYERAFFRSGISDDEFLQNFSFLGQAQAAGQWDLGGISQQQQKSTMFSGAGSAKVRTQLQQALQKQQRFFQKPTASFGTQASGDMLTLKGL
jgi:hypothetical protein